MICATSFFYHLLCTHGSTLSWNCFVHLFSCFLCVILFLCKMSGVMRAAFNSIDFFFRLQTNKNALSELWRRKNSNLLIGHWWRRHFWQVVFFVRLPFEIFVQLVDLFFSSIQSDSALRFHRRPLLFSIFAVSCQYESKSGKWNEVSKLHSKRLLLI